MNQNRNKMGEFIEKLKKIGFHEIIDQSGFSLVIDHPIFSNTIKDCSHLHIPPKVVLRPKNLSQLKGIVENAHIFGIPLTFAGGKTGLSAGYANPFVIVDLDLLETLPKPFDYVENYTKNYQTLQSPLLIVDQNVVVAKLIKFTNMASNGKYFFPIQPSSALKLPVRVGGIVSTNASGLISSGIGSTYDWLYEITYMDPKGIVHNIGPLDPEFNLIVGGMGYYGVVLNVKFKLAKNLPLTNYKIIFGEKTNEMFLGLQKIQEENILPLVSEFISCDHGLFGKFIEFQDFLSPNTQKTMNWALIIKGSKDVLVKFEEILNKFTQIYSRTLNAGEFSLLLQERSTIAILSLPGSSSERAEQEINSSIDKNLSTNNKEYVRFPGFEDILCEPKLVIRAVKLINSILKKHNICPILVVYGHVNFRKGQGILTHVRLPIELDEYCKTPKKMLIKISKIVGEVIVKLDKTYGILPKAEHSVGFLFPWVNQDKISSLHSEMQKGKIFYNPHIKIFEDIKEKHPIKSRNCSKTKEELDDLEIQQDIELLTRYIQHYFNV